MMLRSLQLSILGLLLTAAGAFALEPNRTLTQYVHRIWQIQQGLPQGSIYSVFQAHDGYLWLGTQAGLVRFDGVRFTTLARAGETSVGAPWIADLIEDDSRTLWAATDGEGILAIKPSAAVTYRVENGLPSNNVRCLFADRQGAIWAGTSEGLARFSEGHWLVFPELRGREVRAIGETVDHRLWIGGDSSTLTIWDGSRFTTHVLQSVPANVSIRAMLATPDGTLWVGTTAGLVRLKGQQERCYNIPDGLADDSILDLSLGQNGAIWIGTKDGFSRFQDEQFESFHTRDGLSQSTVYCLNEDRDGNLWVGTKYGLNQFLDRRTIPFTTSEGLPSNDTGPVFQDAQKNIWVGTLGAGLSRFDGRRFSVASVAPLLTSNSILALAENRLGLWAGTERGLNLLRDGRVQRTFTIEDGLPSNVIRCLFRDSEDQLWAGTSAGIVRFQEDHFESVPGFGQASRAPILAIAEHKGSIVFSTEGAHLYSWSNGKLLALNGEGYVSSDIDAFFEDSNGLLWLGTRGGGLGLLDGQRFFRFSMKDGLYDDDIYGIVADAHDRLWMACSKGVFSVARSDLRGFAAGRIQNFVSASFSPIESLRTLECQPGIQPVVWRMDNGPIWFSTIHGLIVVDPEHMERRGLPPPVAVGEVIVDGQSQRPESLGELGPGRTNLEFRYTALSFRAPTRITFRYKLDGFDRDWIEAGTRREAFYTNLPPGPYRFHVQAANIDAPWTEAAVPVAFTVAPRMYQRWWFFPLCAMALIVLGLLAFRVRVQRIRGQLSATLAERSRIARELHDTLMQGFSGVTMEMQALSSRLDESPERDTLQEIIHDAGACLREARRSVAGLRTTNARASGLADAIAQAVRQAAEAGDLRLKLRLGEATANLAPETQYNLVRIAQEAVTNAVRHSGGRNVEVMLQSDSEVLTLQITDDGTGLPPAGPDRAVGHYGLVGMRERAAQIGGTLSIAGDAGRGAVVRLTLPIDRSAVASKAGAVPVA